MLQIQPISSPLQTKQKGNCGNCLENRYTYECSLCQFEYCRDCAKSIQMMGLIYIICKGCVNTIVEQWNRR
jgi:hypothetical protein